MSYEVKGPGNYVTRGGYRAEVVCVMYGFAVGFLHEEGEKTQPEDWQASTGSYFHDVEDETPEDIVGPWLANKFKINDRVRVTSSHNRLAVVGLMGLVIRFVALSSGSFTYYIRNSASGFSGWFLEENLSLAPDCSPKPFAVGDRVKVVKDADDHVIKKYIGQFGRVLEIYRSGRRPVRVKFDDNQKWLCQQDELEHAPLKVEVGQWAIVTAEVYGKLWGGKPSKVTAVHDINSAMPSYTLDVPGVGLGLFHENDIERCSKPAHAFMPGDRVKIVKALPRVVGRWYEEMDRYLGTEGVVSSLSVNYKGDVCVSIDDSRDNRNFNPESLELLPAAAEEKVEVSQAPPPAGYRWLADNEVVHKDDKIVFSSGMELYPNAAIGQTVASTKTRHRSESSGLRGVIRKIEEPKLDVGEGYRRMQPGETIEIGDEWYSESVGWTPITKASTTLGDILNNYKGYAPFRRRQEKEPGFGYRWVTYGEAMEAGDEYRVKDGWTKTLSKEGTILPDFSHETYRRRDPGEGYRVLGDDEVLQEGDEKAMIASARWEETFCPGRTPKSTIRNFGKIAYYRRRKAEAFSISKHGPGVYRIRGGEEVKVTDRFSEGWWEGRCSLQRRTWMDNGSYFGDGSTSPFDIIAYVGPLPPAAPAKEDVPFKIGDRVLVVSSDNIYCQRQAGQKGYVKKIRADGDLVSGHVVYVKTDNQDCLYYKVTDLKKLPTTITLGDDDVIQPGDMVVADNGATWKAMGSVGRTVKVAKAILGRGCQEITRTTNV